MSRTRRRFRQCVGRRAPINAATSSCSRGQNSPFTAWRSRWPLTSVVVGNSGRMACPALGRPLPAGRKRRGEHGQTRRARHPPPAWPRPPTDDPAAHRQGCLRPSRLPFITRCAIRADSCQARVACRRRNDLASRCSKTRRGSRSAGSSAGPPGNQRRVEPTPTNPDRTLTRSPVRRPTVESPRTRPNAERKVRSLLANNVHSSPTDQIHGANEHAMNDPDASRPTSRAWPTDTA